MIKKADKPSFCAKHFSCSFRFHFNSKLMRMTTYQFLLLLCADLTSISQYLFSSVKDQLNLLPPSNFHNLTPVHLLPMYSNTLFFPCLSLRKGQNISECFSRYPNLTWIAQSNPGKWKNLATGFLSSPSLFPTRSVNNLTVFSFFFFPYAFWSAAFLVYCSLALLWFICFQTYRTLTMLQSGLYKE